jgi:acyl-coenzyme A synthetase/AMP-(fatty) acid ligase
MRQTNEAPFALHQGRLITRGNLWSDVQEMAEQLPDRPYVFNLCENRYLFCLVLLAAASRGQVCLLPPSSQMAVIREIFRDYPGSYVASERTPNLPGLEWFTVEATRSEDTALEPHFDWNRTAVIAFTSGSTGKPKPCAHNLATFRISANMAVNSLGFGQQQLLVVSTTPPQHMYGLETSVFWPLFSSLILYDGHPFFPEDVRRVVETAPSPVVLATTPTHLRSLTKTSGSWANLAGVLSATEALSEQLARETDAVLGQSPREIYGSTETLSFASRELLRESLWQPYASSRLIQEDSGLTYLESPHLQTSVLLQDTFKIEADGRFAVLGRDIDMVKIGGKRASLSELNQRLKDIAGVEDGFCFVQQGGISDGRLAAVVVSRLAKQGILEGLRPYVDSLFLPRKIYFVGSIPRNEAGKLTKAEMEKLLSGLG